MPAPPRFGINFAWPPPAAVRGVRREPLDFPRVLSSSFLGGGSPRALEQHMRVRAERRLAAVNLAAQLYRAEHGQWPPTLDALVPMYLPEAPPDPVGPPGQRVRYVLVRGGLPDGGDRPVVYHAGANGVYDTKDPPVLPNVPMYDWMRQPDEWRDLSRWVPPAPPTKLTSAPSTQAAEDQVDEPDDPRESDADE